MKMATESSAAPPKTIPLEQHLRQLRVQGQREQARALIRRIAADQPAFVPQARQLLLAHDERWWSMPQGRRCRLRRRGPQDLAFVRRLWLAEGFLARFNPAAPALPAEDAELLRILGHEFSALATTSQALHWVIETHAGEPFGVLSLVDISFAHRRAEILIGVLQPPYSGAATEATLLAIDFAFGTLKLAKLVGLVPASNAASLAASAHIGFRHEGVLRQHVVDPRSGRSIDIVHMGLLANDEAAVLAQRRVRQRLLKPVAPQA
jgi:RimJ/RimL family protein N-acetyltransferase